MPFPNEHACRLEEPGDFDRFRRDNSTQPHRIFGFKDKGSKIQAFRYPTDKWDAGKAKRHCSANGGRFEKATGPKEATKADLIRMHSRLHYDALHGLDSQAAHDSVVIEMVTHRGMLHAVQGPLDKNVMELGHPSDGEEVEVPTGRIAKPTANYREADGAQLQLDIRCKSCEFLQYDTSGQGNETCRLVEGLIDEDALCDLWWRGSADPSQQEQPAESVEETIVKRGSKYVILSKKGKKLGSFDSRPEAVERLRQIEFFKRRG